MNGPFEVELKIRMTDGESEGVATYNLPAGKYPSKQTIQEALDEALKKAQGELGADWRLQTRHEFENAVISDRYGGMVPEFATKDSWDEHPG